MEAMFEGSPLSGAPRTQFNQDISSWDVSNVIRFSRMFKNNGAFDKISGWWYLILVLLMLDNIIKTAGEEILI